MKSDYLKFTNYKFKQIQNGYHINSDTALLGTFLELKKDKTVLDIGTGTGALLIYAAYFEPKLLVGVEIEKDNIEMAKENLFNLNINHELYSLPIQEFIHDDFDYIICNPPYFQKGENKINYLCKKAMFDDCLKLEELFLSYKRLLKDNGEIFMIYPTIRLQELIHICFKMNFKIMQQKFVYESNKDNAIRVLLRIKKGNGYNTQIKVNKPIFIKDGEILIDKETRKKFLKDL